MIPPDEMDEESETVLEIDGIALEGLELDAAAAEAFRSQVELELRSLLERRGHWPGELRLSRAIQIEDPQLGPDEDPSALARRVAAQLAEILAGAAEDGEFDAVA